MPRKKKEAQTIDYEIVQQSDETIKQHEFELENNPEFSLNVDPTNKYHMSDEQKQFVSLYCEFGSLQFVQATMGIPTEVANAYFISYSCQQEIRRISKAKLHRRFQSKMLAINEIGGFLSSLITDENVPYSERLKPREKMTAAAMLIDLNKFKAEALQNSRIIDNTDVEEIAKNMSIDAIRAMLANKPSDDVNATKDKLISSINSDNRMLPEEIDYLKTLSTVELMQLLNTITKS